MFQFYSTSVQAGLIQHKTKDHAANRCLPRLYFDLYTMYLFNDSNIIIVRGEGGVQGLGGEIGGKETTGET